jgi:hypothetical protein
LSIVAPAGSARDCDQQDVDIVGILSFHTFILSLHRLVTRNVNALLAFTIETVGKRNPQRWSARLSGLKGSIASQRP